MECPSCGHDNSPSSDFCEQCGKKLPLPDHNTEAPNQDTFTASAALPRRWNVKSQIFVVISVVLALMIVAGMAAWSMRTGKMSIASTPVGCQIELNGKVVQGKTPLTLSDLRCGEYNVKLTRPDYHEWTGTAVVNWRSLTHVTGELKPVLTTGFIKVNSSPEDARIILDGKDTGQKTPATLDKVKPGKRNIRVVLPGYDDASGSTSAEKEQTASVDLTLEKLPDKIAYVAGDNSLQLMSPDGSQQQVWKRYTDAIGISPDGAKLAEMAWDGIRISDVGGGLIRLIPHSVYSRHLPALMGKPQTINANKAHGLHWLFDNKRFLIRGSVWQGQWAICLSSTGKAFANLAKETLDYDISQKNTVEQVGRDIFISDLDSSNTVNITKSLEEGGRMPQWSPDGSKAAFISGVQLWTVSSDGSNPKKIVESHVISFVWSSNSNELAYLNLGSNGQTIWTVNADGQNAHDTGVYGDPVWWGNLKGVGNQTGKIRLNSSPSGARIYLNGEYTQEATPATINALPGPNRVQMEYNSRRTDDVVWVKSNEMVTLNGNF